MLLRDNPVLTRELLVNLRSNRSFLLQLGYVVLLGTAVYFGWPNGVGTARRVGPEQAQLLFELFFLGQFFLVALVAPTFASGSITGEKDAETYEMLLASPLEPMTILVGKLLSSLAFLILLIISSLPLMILCYLLGGILLSEVVRAYLVLILAAGTFGLLSVACSSFFSRTSSALVVSYLVVLPLALLCVGMTWRGGGSSPEAREFVTFASIALLPPWALAIWGIVVILINRRLLRPPDVGSEGKEVVDEEQEMRFAVGVVIDRDMFPDRLFAGQTRSLHARRRKPRSRQGTPLRNLQPRNPHAPLGHPSEHVFVDSAHGDVSVLEVRRGGSIRGVCPDVQPFGRAGFSAGSITQERERKTMGLLLTTLLRPGKIVVAKLLAALRVSTVLTLLLTEQLLLAYLLVWDLRSRPETLLIFLAIIAATCLLTTTIGLLCSALSRRTSMAMIMTYMTLLVLFAGPVALNEYLRLGNDRRRATRLVHDHESVFGGV